MGGGGFSEDNMRIKTKFVANLRDPFLRNWYTKSRTTIGPSEEDSVKTG